MLVSEFDYYLPPELIAQHPVEPRDHARLLHLRRAEKTVSHHRFYELPDLLRAGDLLVFNDTRVLKARLHGWKMGENGERGARVEALLLRELSPRKWETLLRPSARLRPGTILLFLSPDEGFQFRAQVLERTASGWHIEFEGDVRPHLAKLGEVPLPPYITEKLGDEERYQTVYSREETRLESAAAPTAGLHFTPQLLEKLHSRGIQTAFVTLAVGIGTFRPIQSETVEEHAMHAEEWEISNETARRIREQKARGGRVVAVGTTTVRVLESAARANGTVEAGSGSTDIFIRPGFRFRAVDAMITNFHLPKSSLLVMITAFVQQKLAVGDEQSAIAALEQVRYAYKQAVAERYRFFSFGDAMFIE